MKMSKNRTADEAPFDKEKYRDSKSGRGKPICRWCGGDVPPPRYNWCSDECVHQRKLRSNPRYLRETVFERDLGICVDCGADTKELVFERWASKVHPEISPSDYASRMKLEGEWETELRGKGYLPHRSLWEADHVVPVYEGGGECGIENIVTRCVPCHKVRTKAQAAERAAKKRELKVKKLKGEL